MCIGLRDLKIALVQGLIGYFARYVSSREFSVSTRVFGFVLTSAESQLLWRELTPQDYGSVANIEIQFSAAPCRELSLGACPIAFDGNVIAKETVHFPSRVWPSWIGVGSGGTATRPSVAGSMDAPLL